jgi:hypothetical protein
MIIDAETNRFGPQKPNGFRGVVLDFFWDEN